MTFVHGGGHRARVADPEVDHFRGHAEVLEDTNISERVGNVPEVADAAEMDVDSAAAAAGEGDNLARAESVTDQMLRDRVQANLNAIDTDGDGMLSSQEEIVSLTNNMCSQLHISIGCSIESVQVKASTLLLESGGGANAEQYLEWFNEHFAGQISKISKQLRRALTRDMEKLKVRICTWNVGNAQPDKSEFALFPKGGGTFDMIVVGMQEATFKEKRSEDKPIHSADSDAYDSDPMIGIILEHANFLSGQASLLDRAHCMSGQLLEHSSIGFPNHEAALDAIATAEERRILTNAPRPRSWIDRNAAPHDPFVLVKHASLMEMRLCVLIRKSKQQNTELENIQATTEATGLFNAVGNKGGLVVRFSYRGTSFAFVSCHLAAHEGESYMERRNNDLNKIWEATAGMVTDVKADFITDTDFVFILGDLNYRLNEPDFESRLELADEGGMKDWRTQVLDWIETRNWTKLWQYDELRQQMKVTEQMKLDGKHPEVLFGFTEPVEYPFPPTFKFKQDKQTKRYNGTEYNEERIPSYCDRILWKSHPAKVHRLEAMTLNSITAHTTSDHLPVCGTFSVSIPDPIELPAVRPKGAATIQFMRIEGSGNLKAMDLDTGKSDCMLQIWSQNLTKADPGVSHVKYETLVPEWTEAEIPPLECFLTSKEGISDSYIQIAMVDVSPSATMTGVVTKLMGTAMIPLNPFMQDDDPFKDGGHGVQGFSLQAAKAVFAGLTVPLVLYGKPSGYLTVELNVIWDDDWKSPYEPESTCTKCCKSCHSPLSGPVQQCCNCCCTYCNVS